MSKSTNPTQTDLNLFNRQLHSIAVGKVMYELAERNKLDPLEMYELGCMHDIGYFLPGGDNKTHAHLAYEHLKHKRYKYADEVRLHGMYLKFQSPALLLLNYADMIVDSKGNIVGLEERLKEILDKYGDDSEVCNNILVIYEMLKEAVTTGQLKI